MSFVAAEPRQGVVLSWPIWPELGMSKDCQLRCRWQLTSGSATYFSGGQGNYFCLFDSKHISNSLETNEVLVLSFVQLFSPYLATILEILLGLRWNSFECFGCTHRTTETRPFTSLDLEATTPKNTTTSNHNNHNYNNSNHVPPNHMTWQSRSCSWDVLSLLQSVYIHWYAHSKVPPSEKTLRWPIFCLDSADCFVFCLHLFESHLQRWFLGFQIA